MSMKRQKKARTKKKSRAPKKSNIIIRKNKKGELTKITKQVARFGGRTFVQHKTEVLRRSEG